MTDPLDEVREWDDWLVACVGNGRMGVSEALGMARLPRTREEIAGMAEPIRLDPSPSVALCAYRFPSRSRGRHVTHDVALMVSPEPGKGPTWDCTCESFTLGGRTCDHVREAMRLWNAERVAAHKARVERARAR